MPAPSNEAKDGDGRWVGQAGELLTSQAKISSIERDLGLSDVQYQTSVSILFVGYILYVFYSTFNIQIGRGTR